MKPAITSQLGRSSASKKTRTGRSAGKPSLLVGPEADPRLSPSIRGWMLENKIDQQQVVQEVESAFRSRPVPKTSLPVKFWNLNREIRALEDEWSKRGSPLPTWDPPDEYRSWLQSFRINSIVANSKGSADSYTYLWTGKVLSYYHRNSKLVHADSNQFESRGVGVGDTIFIIVFEHGRLLLVGKLEVGEMGPYNRIKPLLKHPQEANPYKDHLIAINPGRMHFDLVVPMEVVAGMRYVTPQGRIVPPKLRVDGGFDPQTFRGVRKIMPDTSARLNALLDE